MTVLLNSNPFFETDVSGWFVNSDEGSIAHSTAQAHQGTGSLLLTPDGVGSQAAARSTAAGGVIPGQVLRSSAWVRCAVGRNIRIRIDWRDASGVFLSASSADTSVVANTWTYIEIVASAVANAAEAGITVLMTGTPPGSNTLYVDEARLERLGLDIISSYNDSYHSPGFDLTVTGLTGYDKLTIERVDVSGEFPDAPVRGADGVAVGGSTFGASDYEAPIGNAVYYRATASAQTFTEDWNRTVSNGFGIGPFEMPWTLAGGELSSFSVTPGFGGITLPSAPITEMQRLAGSSFGDFDVQYTVKLSAIATGAEIYSVFLSHYQDATNNYGWYVIFRPFGQLDFALLKLVNNIATGIVNQFTIGSYTADTPVNVRLQKSGVDMRAKIWTSGSEPVSWNASSSDSTYSGGEIGLRATALAGVTNTSPKVSFGPIQISNPNGSPAISTSVDSAARIAPADDPGTVYLKSTGQPALNRRVNVVDFDEVSRPGRVLGEYEVLGRKNKVVITDVLSGREGSLTIVTFPSGGTWWNGSQWQDIQILLQAGGTLLLQTAGRNLTGEDDMYLVVNGVGRKRVGIIGGELVHLHTIGYIEVDRPDSAGQTVSVRTWQDVINQNATWGDVVANYATWLDVLQRNI